MPTTFDPKLFFDTLRSQPDNMFPDTFTAETVAGIDGVLKAFAMHGDGDKRTLAYALATKRGEVGQDMLPVREGFTRTDGAARRAVLALAKKRGPRSGVAKYARPVGPYGHWYYGRGDVQVTFIEGYAGSSKDAGVDLVKNPDAMLNPDISARVLIKGLIDGRWNGKKKGIGFYLHRATPDLKNARRTVNITDKWEKFAGFYKNFLAAIDAAGGGVPVPVKPNVAVESPRPVLGPEHETPATVQSAPAKPNNSNATIAVGATGVVGTFIWAKWTSMTAWLCANGITYFCN